MQHWSPIQLHDEHLVACRPHKHHEFASISRKLRAGRSHRFATLVGFGCAQAELLEFVPSLRVTVFTDRPTEDSISSDALFSGRVDVYLGVNNIFRAAR